MSDAEMSAVPREPTLADPQSRGNIGEAWDTPTREEIAAAARRLGPAASLVAGVLDIAGARALALDALFRVSAVQWSGDVYTAMVECTDRPRMLLNPVFVERWCTTRERLAALLLHELSHVSMGHTKLFPRPTVARNIACDAVINRELLVTARSVDANVLAMAELFIDYYDPAASPWFLLRPPPGWPDSSDWTASRGCPRPLRGIHRRLYADASAKSLDGKSSGRLVPRHTVMYSEIVTALEAAAAMAKDDHNPLARLLGGHGSTAAEREMLSGGRDALGAELLAPALAPLSGRLAGYGSDQFTHHVETTARRANLERALGLLIREAFTAGALSRCDALLRQRPARGVDPSRDRRAAAHLALARRYGAPRPLIFNTSVIEAHAAPRDAVVYLDVSGSMYDVLPVLHASMVPLRRALRPRIYVFSNVVVPVSDTEFDMGRLPGTGGTSITPVLEHLLKASVESRNRSAVIITDGEFDDPDDTVAAALVAAKVRIHLGLTSCNRGRSLAAAWITSVTTLPML